MLSDSDRAWLEDKFNRLHQRVDAGEEREKKRDSDIHNVEVIIAQLKAASCPSVLSHEEKHHNPVKTWGILTAMVGVAAGLLEISSRLFKGWGKQ
jgi:hypothetical protein